MNETIGEQQTDLEWRRQVLADYAIAPELRTMKEAREAVEKAMINRSRLAREELWAVQQELDLAEATAVMAIAGQVDEKGKAAGNAETRKAQLVIALAQDAGYQSATRRKATLQGQIDTLDAHIASDEHRYSSAKQSLIYKAGALRLLAGGG